MRFRFPTIVAAACLIAAVAPVAGAKDNPKNAANAADSAYAAYVWPGAPDKPRIRLVTILKGRSDVEATSKLARTLLGASPPGRYDWLRKPFGVQFDRDGRLLVTDSSLGALFRFDRQRHRLDVFGTKGPARLKLPLGLAVANDGTIYVADAAQQRVFAFDTNGNVKSVIGKSGELTNPTGVALSPDGATLYVADSKAHRIAIFDTRTGALLRTFGKRGEGEGQFNFPTSIAATRDELLVIDQINARVQIFSTSGDFIESFGGTGTSFGNFVRPKGIAVDEQGLLYVSDAAFGNVQIFASDLTLLTFVGQNGTEPGQFQLAAGVAARGDEFAVVDQLNKRVQLFRFIAPKNER